MGGGKKILKATSLDKEKEVGQLGRNSRYYMVNGLFFI